MKFGEQSFEQKPIFVSIVWDHLDTGVPKIHKLAEPQNSTICGKNIPTASEGPEAKGWDELGWTAEICTHEFETGVGDVLKYYDTCSRPSKEVEHSGLCGECYGESQP